MSKNRLLKTCKVFLGGHPVYYPWNHQKAYSFLMISGGIEVHEFVWIFLMLEANFKDNP